MEIHFTIVLSSVIQYTIYIPVSTDEAVVDLSVFPSILRHAHD